MGAFFPKNSPRREFSINSTYTSNTITEPCEVKTSTPCASPSYHTCVWTKYCGLTRDASLWKLL
jgi:hypothetical protein